MVSSRTAMMDLRRVVGGLLTRNAVLSTLLINYADRLDQGHLRRGVATAPCFIVPTWGVDQFPPLRSTLLTVEAHASPTDPGLHEDLDAILRLLHVVLTDDHAGTLITARRVEASADLRVTGLDTVVRVGTWDIAPIPPSSLGAAQRRLLPWPDCRTSIIDTGAPAPGTTRVN